MGHYWEDFNINDVFKTDSIKITEDMVNQFATLSGDNNPFHVNPKEAIETIYGRPIAHGLLVMSLFTGLNRKLGILKGTSLGVIQIDWNFHKPVYVNDTIYFEQQIVEKRETSKPDRGILKRMISTRILNEDIEVYNGYFTNLVKRIK